MTITPLNRRSFLRMGAALPIASAVLPSIANSAFAAVPSAGVPAVGYIDVPPNVALLNINEYPSGPTPAAVEIMHKMATNGNRYYMAESAALLITVSLSGTFPISFQIFAPESF